MCFSIDRWLHSEENAFIKRISTNNKDIDRWFSCLPDDHKTKDEKAASIQRPSIYITSIVPIGITAYGKQLHHTFKLQLITVN